MNIEMAKCIAMSEFLEKLGMKPIRQNHKELWYLSPFRNERTASLKVHIKRNKWYDFGIGIGGDIIDFAQCLLESRKKSHAVTDALKTLSDVMGEIKIQQPLSFPFQDTLPEKSTLFLKSVKDVEHQGLINYLSSRGIPKPVGINNLKQVRFFNSETKKNILALGIQNEEGGYEVRNPFFKGCIGKKHVTFIRGKKEKPEGINFFEGMMDYLTVVTLQDGRPLINDTIILNSLSCIKLSLPFLKEYGYKTAYTWMDNDKAGKAATLFLDKSFLSEKHLTHQPMNNMYLPFKDVNAWHMNKLEL